MKNMLESRFMLGVVLPACTMMLALCAGWVLCDTFGVLKTEMPKWLYTITHLAGAVLILFVPYMAYHDRKIGEISWWSLFKICTVTPFLLAGLYGVPFLHFVAIVLVMLASAKMSTVAMNITWSDAVRRWIRRFIRPRVSGGIATA